jgi:hypothetical protein
MRSTLPLLLVASTLSGCSCSKSGASTPTPVTLVFTNTSSAPVFLDATDSTYGLVITPQGSSATDPAYMEMLGACGCLSCDIICNAGGCPGTSCGAPVPTNPLLQLLPTDAGVQRTWSGVYVQDSQESCGALVGGQACLQVTNDFPDDTFTARICYALSVNGGQVADAGVPFPGTLPPGELVCATQDFQPQQGTVFLTPPPAASCSSDGGNSCPAGQLCFAGACSSGCPENDFPPYGGAYYVNVSTPSGPFFLQSTSGSNAVSSGTGTLTSFSFSGGTTDLRLVSDAGFNGDITFTLPQVGTACCLEAFHPGEILSVTVIETPPGSGNRGLVIRDASGQLVQAVDMAGTAPVLSATDTAPFTVTLSTTSLGCASVEPGCKALFSGTVFSTPEGASSLVVPGQFLNITTSGANFGVLNVTDTTYQAGDAHACDSFTPLAPYVILNTRS